MQKLSLFGVSVFYRDDQGEYRAGGQLKGVLARLVEVLVDSQTLEKKKMAAMTSETVSAKIVATIPLIFMLILNYVNPDENGV